MNGLTNLKTRLKIIKQLAVANNFGYHCPNCSNDNRVTAYANAMKDELYHKTKFFIRCRHCKLTTPAYETIKEASSAWEEVCASVEAKC